jgi:hypothetical protein
LPCKRRHHEFLTILRSRLLRTACDMIGILTSTLGERNK